MAKRVRNAGVIYAFCLYILYFSRVLKYLIYTELYNVEFTMECSIRLAVSLSEEDLRAFPGDQLHFRCHHTFYNFFVIIIIVVIITLSSELLLMPVNGTFHLVSADKGQGRQAAATEI